LRDLLIFVSGFLLRIAAKSGNVSETFFVPGFIGFAIGSRAPTITHVRFAAKSGKVIENILVVSRALASPSVLTCRKMCPSVFLAMIAYAYA
jgi:hypothetical protein